MKMTFYQRANSIYCRIYHQKDMVRLSTGIRVPSHVKWLPSREQFAGTTPDVGMLNIDLSRQKVLLTQLFDMHKDLEKVKQEFTTPIVEVVEMDQYSITSLLHEYVQGMISGKIKTKKNMPFREASIRAYRFCQRSYEFFAAKYGTLDIMDLDLTGKDLRQKKEIADKLNKHLENLKNYMLDQGYDINTRSNMLNIVGLMINYWKDELFLTLPKVTRIESYQTPIVTLPEEFIKAFLNDKHNFYHKFSNENKFMWEITAIMLVTSLRISDATNLMPYHFSFKNGDGFLIKDNIKTGKETMMPLPSFISEKIAFNIDNYGGVYSLKNMNAQYTRRAIKKFLAHYPEMHEVYRYSRKNHRGQYVEVSGKLCDMVHPHMLRKTAITTMLANGVSEEHVRFASGHCVGSGAFHRYVGFVEQRHKSEIENFYGKLGI